MEFCLVNGEAATFLLEEECYSGVAKIAEKVCGDVELVTGIRPVTRRISKTYLDEQKESEYVVLVGTVGKSSVLEKLNGRVPLDKIRGKRESFLFQIVDNGTKATLVIAGSDKRGTIYGLFHLSEYMGVSPWVHFSDVLPEKRKKLTLTEKDNMISREPSVKYRGFFINDEWPAFGSWTFEHFGGFTEEMYDLIFETLLRLKGNYLWPAMWTSSFP